MAVVRELFLISFALFAVLNAAVIKQKWQSRIVGGHTAEKDQLPYMVGIFQFNEVSVNIICGGVILNNRTILTSASCIEGYQMELNKLIAILGTPTPSSGNDNSFQVYVDYVKLHNKYDSKTRAFDLAVLRTKDEIKFSHAIDSVSLPKSDLDLENGLPVGVCGWGLVEEPVNFDFEMAKQVQMLHTTAIDRNRCLSEFAKVTHENSELNEISEQLTENSFCALNPSGKSLGIGDGSPLVSNGEVVGVASRIMGCGVPDVYTKVYPHLKWIQNEMDRNLNSLN